MINSSSRCQESVDHNSSIKQKLPENNDPKIQRDYIRAALNVPLSLNNQISSPRSVPLIMNEIPISILMQFYSKEAQISLAKEQETRAKERKKVIKGIQMYYTKEGVFDGTVESKRGSHLTVYIKNCDQ